MKKEYIVFVALFVISLLNTVAFFTHPAYRYYKRNITNVEKHFDAKITDFEVRVSDSIMPAVYLAITNRMQYSNPPVDSSPSFDSYQVPTNSPYAQPKTIEASYFTHGRNPYLNFNGFYLRVGDNFDGTPITSMSPYAITTRISTYEIKPPSRSFSPAPNSNSGGFQ